MSDIFIEKKGTSQVHLLGARIIDRVLEKNLEGRVQGKDIPKMMMTVVCPLCS